MNLVSVRCNHCGAPLRVADSARFVTCQFCRTELMVEHTDSAVFTQKITEIHEHTAQMSDDLEVIRLQNELELIDREWQMERESFLVSDKHGHRHEPGTFGSLAGGIVAVIAGCVWFMITSNHGAPSFFPLLGLVVIGIGVVGAVVGMSKASALEEARTRYEHRRRPLVRRLAAERGGGEGVKSS